MSTWRELPSEIKVNDIDELKRYSDIFMVREKEKRRLKDTVDTNQAGGDVINLKKNLIVSDVLFRFKNSFCPY